MRSFCCKGIVGCSTPGPATRRDPYTSATTLAIWEIPTFLGFGGVSGRFCGEAAINMKLTKMLSHLGERNDLK